MTTKYDMNFSYTFPFSDTTAQVSLAATTAQSYTVPGTSNQLYRALFKSQYGAEVYVRLNGTAAIPTSGMSTTLNYQELIPFNEARYVKGGDVLSFISPAAAQVSVSLLQVQDIT